MTGNYDGATLLDTDNEKVGSVDRTYVDDAGTAQFLSVKTGTILTRHHLVPAESLTETDNGIQVPWLKALIEESPVIDSGDTLEGEQLETVRSYYRNNGSLASTGDDSADGGANSGASQQLDPETISAIGEANPRNRPASDFPEGAAAETPPGFGEVRDLGDVIEVPIVEEVMVKKRVVREVLRIRKSHFVESGTVATDLRHEEIEVMPSGDDALTNSGSNGSKS